MRSDFGTVDYSKNQVVVVVFFKEILVGWSKLSVTATNDVLHSLLFELWRTKFLLLSHIWFYKVINWPTFKTQHTKHPPHEVFTMLEELAWQLFYHAYSSWLSHSWWPNISKKPGNVPHWLKKQRSKNHELLFSRGRIWT